MAMVMIDFTIVSISATTIQADLGLSETAQQWLVTAYALSTAAFVALGGRLGDIVGHRRIVIVGIVVFAASSLMCGLVPDSGSIAEPWLILFRVLQGLGGALLIPSATVLVLDAFPTEERGKGLAVFFIAAGLFTAIGPVAGSYLTEFWTWRAIFWINVPVAVFALTEFAFVKIADVKNPSPIDWRGAFLIVAGMGLSVLGIQQSTVWGWGDPATLGSIVAGVIFLAAFVAVERNAASPLIDVRELASNRQFAVDNVLTFLAFGPWLGVFFFGSVYFQVAVHQPPTQAGFSILTMFYSFFIAARIGGGWMDKHGAGFGLIFSPLNTDALNRLPDAMRGQGSGVVQTFRNFGSAIGMAVMGTIVASATDVTGAAGAQDFADAMETAFYVGAGMLAVGYVIARVFMDKGKQSGVE